MHLGLTPQHVGHPRGAGVEVVAEMEVLAIAGPVFDHTRLTVDGLPAIVTAQAQGIAVATHDAIAVGETAHRIAVTIDHFDQLAEFVVTVLHQCFHGDVGNDALDLA
ncbi:hypothetical protein D3C87_1762100 [compost metagenome]